MTVQMTLDEKLVKTVDSLAHRLRTSRSAFAREALKEAIRRYRTLELERKHKHGYSRSPAAKGEFDVPEEDRAWGES